MLDLHGIMTAIVTPLNADNTINEEELKNLIDFQIKNGVHCLLALGGTGEYTALTMAERKHMVEATVKFTARRVPVIIGNLETGLGESIAFSNYCKDAGADAVMVMTPYYVHPTQQGIYDYYMALDKAVDLPILVYNIPYRTNVNVTPETLERLANDMKHLSGIKECNNSPAQCIEYIRRVGDKISVFSGEEYLSVMLMALGAKGAVMATANVFPAEWVKMYELSVSGKAGEALEILGKYTELIGAMFSEINPGPLKHALDCAGYPCGPVATPLVPVSEGTKARVEAALKELGLMK